MHRFPYFYSPYYHLWPFSTEAQAVNDSSHFPPVDTKKFQFSAHEFHQLMKQANSIINQIEHSPQFAKELMQAAQQSNQVKVEQLVSSIDESVLVETRYTPDGIQMKYRDKKGMCCVLTIGLGW
ncbi:hypothetical protein [Sporosarcina obsidiansis]|uniref:hypothetical protein n=1 Tax=Sporosarcina obsidiansis TaxID=2660748 RepID=UPI00129B07F2|nr:hypothetical protein [Sporosarcina obsidiansis]